ncbi:MAG: glycosyltransferase [Candidatus Nanohaloarchaea archaeon]|nr:glycosyltransferase [Candidatus Nanohaloarchaea archaeon]
MKIALFTDTYLPTVNGISYAIHNWKEELESRGHEATIVCPAPGSDEDDVTFASINFPFYQGFRASVFPPVTHDFSEYDVVHLNSFFGAGLYGMWAATKHNLPVVATVHTPIEEYLEYISSSTLFQKFAYSIYHEWETYLINKSNRCLTPTAAVRDEVKNDVLQDIHVLSNGVDTEFFRPQDDTAFREEFGIDDERVIGYTGRLGREKRLDELIALADRFDGTILIGGDGPMREQYRNLARGQDNVIFTGFIDRERLPELYSCLDIFVFPSRVETEGLVGLEANACGTPVVGADAGGLRNAIEDGRNGYHYEPGNVADLHDKIEKAYSSLDDLTAGAREAANTKSLEQTVDRLLEHYGDVTALDLDRGGRLRPPGLPVLRRPSLPFNPRSGD